MRVAIKKQRFHYKRVLAMRREYEPKSGKD